MANQPIIDFDVSAEDFFAPLNLPQSTKDIIFGIIAAYTGADPSRSSMLSIVAKVAAFGHSPYGFVGALTERFVGGATRLLKGMIDGSKLEVRLDHRVVSVNRTPDGVTVRTDEEGFVLKASECIIAVPTNALKHVDFTPDLSLGRMKRSHSRHIGRLLKPIIHISNIPAGVFALRISDLQMVCTAYELADGSSVLCGFGSDGIGDLDLDNRESVERALRKYFPEVEVLSICHPDWLSDPLFNGTHCVNRLGEAYEFLAAMNEPEDRLVFAGTDVDTSIWRSWMEAALNSARDVVGVTSGNLARRSQ